MTRLIVSAIVSIVLLCQAGLGTTTFSVEGRVLDHSTGEPVVGATVRVVGDELGTFTDSAGAFLIEDLPSREYTLQISAVGYSTVTRTVMPGASGVEVSLEHKAVPVGDITVTASRFGEEIFETASSVSVTSSEEFRKRSFSTTSEALREEPAVLVQKTTHGHGAPVIRGLIGKYVLLLYDGVRLNKPTFRFGANQYLNTVDLETLDRIEVVRGPSSVMYGSDAIGGTINLVPPTLSPNGTHVAWEPSVSTRYSSADDGKSVNVGLGAASRKFSGKVGVTLKDVGDVRGGGDVGKQRPTGWSEANYNARLAYVVDDRRSLNIDYLHVDQSEVPRYDKYVANEFQTYVYDPQKRDLAAVTYSSRPENSFVDSWKANVSYQREVEGKTTQKISSPEITVSEDKVTTWGGFVQASAGLGAHRLTVGSEYYNDRVNSEAIKDQGGVISGVRGTFPDDTKYSSFGLFSQDEWSLSDRLKLTGGARVSVVTVDSPLEEPFGRFEETYKDLTGSLSLSYQPVPVLNLISRWSRGFRAPNLNDAVVLKYSSSGVDAPSLDLSPENSDNFEFGAKVRNDRVRGSLFAFYNRLTDLIDRVPGTYAGLSFLDENGNGVQDDDEFDIYQKSNVDRARIYGFEYSGVLDVSDRWEFGSSVFWTRGDNLSDDEPMSRIPPLMWRFGVRMNQSESFWTEIYVRGASDQRRLSMRDTEDSRIGPWGTDGWNTVNLRSGIEYRQFKINIALENVFDEAYKEHGSGVYSPGRNLLISLAVGAK